MAIVMNCLPDPLPQAYELSYDEQSERAELELRADLKLSADPRGLKPLTREEQKKFRAYKAQKWLERPPRWNGVNFPFAPCGKPGSAYELPEAVAFFIADKYNQGVKFVRDKPSQEILHILTAGEVLPPGVVPIRPHIEDPKKYSSEAILASGNVVEGGSAPPPPKQNPMDNVVSVNDMRDAGLMPNTSARTDAIADAVSKAVASTT